LRTVQFEIFRFPSEFFSRKTVARARPRDLSEYNENKTTSVTRAPVGLIIIIIIIVAVVNNDAYSAKSFAFPRPNASE